MDALVLCSTVHTGAAMVLFGTLAVRPRLGADPSMAAAIGRDLRRLIVAAAGLALLSAVAWLLLASAAMADDPAAMTDPGAVLTVLDDTAFGRVWQVRLILAVAILGLTLRHRAETNESCRHSRESGNPAGGMDPRFRGDDEKEAVIVACRLRRRGAGQGLLLVLAALQLASLGLVGHPAMEEGMAGLYQKANQAVHLLAAAAWLGVLPSLMILWAVARSRAAWRELEVALRRFSSFGAVAVILLLLSGVFNVWVRTGGRPGFLGSPYGTILLIKVALVAGMIALAVINRFVLTPALSRETMRGRRRWLGVSLGIETSLGLLVLAVAFVLGSTAPP